MEKGITIIEILLVISLVSIIATASTPFASSFIARNNWHVSVDRIISEIYKAQNYAMDGKSIGGNVTWGVCISGSNFRMFNGTCASPNYSEDYPIPNGISVTGLTTITFGNLRGEPTPVSTINVSSSVGSNTITLNAAGMVQVN